MLNGAWTGCIYKHQAKCTLHTHHLVLGLYANIIQKVTNRPMAAAAPLTTCVLLMQWDLIKNSRMGIKIDLSTLKIVSLDAYDATAQNRHFLEFWWNFGILLWLVQLIIFEWGIFTLFATQSIDAGFSIYLFDQISCMDYMQTSTQRKLTSKRTSSKQCNTLLNGISYLLPLFFLMLSWIFN